MTQNDTVTRILDTAEELFAERGFAETSLRTITATAKVNLAAVNYHFGSKKELIQAVFARFMTPFTLRLEEMLDKRTQQEEPIEVKDILEMVARATLATGGKAPHRLTIFMRLTGLAYTQGQGHVRKFLQEKYSNTFGRFWTLFIQATPDLSPNERFWRFHFMLGSAAFTMSSMDSLIAIAEYDLKVSNSVDQVVELLLPFLTAGIQGPLPVTTEME